MEASFHPRIKKIEKKKKKKKVISITTSHNFDFSFFFFTLQYYYLYLSILTMQFWKSQISFLQILFRSKNELSFRTVKLIFFKKRSTGSYQNIKLKHAVKNIQKTKL